MHRARGIFIWKGLRWPVPRWKQSGTEPEVSLVSGFWEAGHGAVTFCICVTCADSFGMFHAPQLQG